MDRIIALSSWSYLNPRVVVGQDLVNAQVAFVLWPTQKNPAKA